ncbi:hypothetical protein SEVIR_5G224400v4 [Setaria viridis]|uniref:Uncharacterized protein n=2 Tax=Setaria TaxID=4554 RepID=K3XI20_SETIT|nr:uncharacterized protein LOC101771245 [Setaria italica]XP_034593201.1 uncharacterized protein LOC117855036 [Setaria viridis]RCV26090.1 hypothetical protein SETIT_5G217700v2 [Setaria italica]TKW15240.1 hypothetical protein SEVIR_5G224400v2 [Setaria viridis]
MTSVTDPSQPPPARTPSTIHSLGEDLLLDIFLRLPSLAALIRAALTCRAWRRAVASSPAFRRHFRDIHRAPLLGLFFETPSVGQAPAVPAFPSFVPARRSDRDLAAAVRGGDFFLTSLQERPGGPHGWDILDCRGGYILLRNDEEEIMAVLNPLARRSERFFDLAHEDTLQGHRGYPVVCYNACLLCSDEDPLSFRVVLLAHDESRVRATFFSSDTNEWSILPWVNVPASSSRKKFWLLDSSMQSKGFLYWVYKNRKYMITLNTVTMEFSVDELPQLLKNEHCSFVVGETSSGARCIVYAIDFCVGLLLRRTENGIIERWDLQWAARLDTQLDQVLGELISVYDELQVVAVRDGFAYLATSEKSDDTQTPSWFLSFCLQTMELEKLFQRTYDAGVYPYVMTWPPSLVGNYGSFALEDATQNAITGHQM